MEKTQNEIIEIYWQSFLASLPADSAYRNRPFAAEGWGDGPEMADELGALIASGTKTATCSAVWEWQAEGESWPEPGHITIVLDGRDQPLCIVETLEVTIKPYNEVEPAFAFEEGEGDPAQNAGQARSLEYWSDVHRRFFSRSLSNIGREFAEDMPLVCERFRVIYK